MVGEATYWAGRGQAGLYAVVGGLGCYRLGHWKREIRGEASWLVLSLLPDGGRRRRYNCCYKWIVPIHGDADYCPMMPNEITKKPAVTRA